MDNVIDYRSYQKAADRWLTGARLNLNRRGAEIVALALGEANIYESSIGYFVDTAPSGILHTDSGDCS